VLFIDVPMLYYVFGKCQDIDNPILMLKSVRTSITLIIFWSEFFCCTIRAENHHVREWAPNKLVGAHDDFSAAR
jgi:hypothetical protein